MLEAACQQFLGKTNQQILEVARETLEGHQRAIMGNMTVEVGSDDKSISPAGRLIQTTADTDFQLNSRGFYKTTVFGAIFISCSPPHLQLRIYELLWLRWLCTCTFLFSLSNLHVVCEYLNPVCVHSYPWLRSSSTSSTSYSCNAYMRICVTRQLPSGYVDLRCRATRLCVG